MMSERARAQRLPLLGDDSKPATPNSSTAAGSYMVSCLTPTSSACSPTTSSNLPLRHDFSRVSLLEGCSPPPLWSDVIAAASPTIFTNAYSEASLKQARNAYNMATYITKQLQLLSITFTTAMTFYHEVAGRLGESGVAAVSEVVLVSACLLLAAKAEHDRRMRLSKLVVVAFAIDAATTASEGAYQRMVLETERLVISHLNFNFLRISPLTRLAEVSPHPNGADAAAADADLSKNCNKLFSYLLMSPIIAELPANAIADALVHITAQELGTLDKVSNKLTFATPEVVRGVYAALLVVMSKGGKKSFLPGLNEKLAAMRSKRGRGE